jgi:hypothetical protein
MKNRQRLVRYVVTAALLVSGTAALMAQQSRVYKEGNAWVEETTGTLPGAKNLTVKMDVGSVTVQGGNQQGITYTLHKRSSAGNEATARRELQAFRFSATSGSEGAVLRGDLQARTPGRMVAELTVQVPRGIELVKTQTSAGNQTVHAVAGRVVADTGGGLINLDDIGGAVKAMSGGGNITVGNLDSDLAVTTGGGNVQIGNVKGRIMTTSGGGNVVIGSSGQGAKIETGGGAVDMKHCGGDFKVQTGGGNIRLASAAGPVVAETGGGSIELMNLLQGAKAETGGGEIRAEFLGAKGFTGADLETPAGDVIVYLGSDVKATIKASVDVGSGHGIQSDFSEIRVTSEGGQFGPKMYFADGSLNGGGPVLRLRTTTGSIQIRRAKK